MAFRHPGPLKSETFIPWDNCRFSGVARGIEVSLNFWKAVDRMEIWITVLLFLLGLLLIIKGGDWFLDGAVWIAEATGVPRFIIGATIVSLATTLPELTVSVTGTLQGSPWHWPASPASRGRWTWRWATPWAPSPPTWGSS